jgi:deoxycytidylate deaminase
MRLRDRLRRVEPDNGDVAEIHRHDSHYMKLAEAVCGSMTDNEPNRGGANCWGSKVGAVIVLGGGPLARRVVSTGYNGTPSGSRTAWTAAACRLPVAAGPGNRFDLVSP